MRIKTALDLKIGERGIISGYTSIREATKFLTMGFRPDCSILLIRRSPFGGNLCFEMNNQLIALRSKEAQMIQLK